MQSQELTLPPRHVVEAPVTGAATVVLLPRRPDRDLAFALVSTASALVWALLLVVAVRVGCLCAAVDGVLRLRRPVPSGP